MTQDHTLLVINPGSTSTKVSWFEGDEGRFSETLPHSAEELARFPSIAAQAPFRREAIDRFLAAHGLDPVVLAAVVARGGLLHPLEGGVYAVNDAMVADLESGGYGHHASNLGGIIARAIADAVGCPAYIADPVVVDELDELARLSGLPDLPRRSIFHALNQKSAAREACRRLGRSYESSNLIVAHMGGGVSVGAHRAGRVVDVNNALDGEGPFSPERAGTLPAGQLVDLVLSGRHTEAEIRRMITGAGGVVAYAGTNDVRELIARAHAGEEHAELVLRAMCYQIAREISSHGATLAGSVDAVVLTGGMAHNDEIVSQISARVGFLAEVVVIPGEREMVSLAAAALGALRGEREVRTYG
ncbi:MAG: butyrate kinase [Spirochaetota bacterium]